MPTEPAAGVTVEELIRHRLSTALGGWRGSVETALPTVAFVILWVWRKDLTGAIVASVAVTLVLAVLRIVQRQSLQYVLSAVFATAIAAFFALRSGRAQDAFLPGIIWNGVMLAVATVSVATRWPLVGFMVGAGDPDDQHRCDGPAQLTGSDAHPAVEEDQDQRHRDDVFDGDGVR